MDVLKALRGIARRFQETVGKRGVVESSMRWRRRRRL